jgi:hypothetical protein
VSIAGAGLCRSTFGYLFSSLSDLSFSRNFHAPPAPFTE